jgi:hypothetical protein
MSDLFSFQGKIFLAERLSTGKMGKQTWVGDAPTCTVQFQTETTEKTESFSGNRLPYGRLRRGKTATINLTLNEWLISNLALGLHATHTAQAGASVTNEAFPTGLVAGDMVRVDNPFISALTITDSAGTPATLTAGTHYRLDSADAGRIEIVNVAAFTQPFRANYTYAAADLLSIFGETPPERWLYLDGTNTENGEPVIVDLYRVSFDPISDLGLIHEEYGELSMTGSVLYDPLNANGSNLHGFGMIRQKQAA